MQRIDFEKGALASLRRRVAEMEELNDDLVAYARGHAGATVSIHEAVLAAMAADTREAFCRVLTWQWPRLLKVDAVGLAWARDGHAFRADREGEAAVEARLVERMADRLPELTIRPCARAHPLFGAAGETVRSEAIVRLGGTGGVGLLALGQAADTPAEARHGARLLRFLGRAASTMLEKWPAR